VKRLLALLAVSLVLLTALTGLATVVKAARIPGLAIIADLSHGQNPGGLAEAMKMVPEAHWIVLVKSEEDKANIPEEVLKVASEVRVGGFTPDNIGDVDMIIVGQPTMLPSDEEVVAITDWFSKELKAIWLAADSDYPAQGTETAQQFADIILEAIGSKLRVDFVSVEEHADGYYAKRTYRVLGVVDPPPELAFLGYGCKKVLFHGPGVVAAVAPDGTWVNPLKTPVEGVYVVVRTTDQGTIVEHQPKAPGAPGNVGIAYAAGDTGRFPLLAVEIMPNGNRVIASGESPYSGYQAGVTWEYYGYKLQGPRFFRNMVLWATQYMGELAEVEKLYSTYKELEDLKAGVEKAIKIAGDNAGRLGGLSSAIDSLRSAIDDVKGKVSGLEGKVGSLSSDIGKVKSDISSVKSDVSGVKGTLGSIQSDVSGLKSSVSDLSSKVDGLAGRVGGVEGSVNGAIALGVVALILAIVAIALAFRKR